MLTKTLILASLCTLLCGCQHVMSNKAIVEEVRFCEANGLKAYVIQGWITDVSIAPIRVECGPK